MPAHKWKARGLVIETGIPISSRVTLGTVLRESVGFVCRLRCRDEITPMTIKTRR